LTSDDSAGFTAADLEFLNYFFETVADPIFSRWGEVLKFIGDGVLAIFSVDGDPGDACAAARDAAVEIISALAETTDSTLRCAIGLHVGEVNFGNVGAPDRLDFTVIGSAAAISTRLSDQCKVMEQSQLLSSAV
ncbi:MAG: adenylate/guanylate cyclase domain-containing protein, partial [Alphaproteobacteria bacterium]